LTKGLLNFYYENKRPKMWQGKYSFLLILLIILFQNLNSYAPIKVYLKIYWVPMYQSRVSAEETENGQIVGGMIGGNVTALFPAGVVILDSDLGKDASDSIVQDYIKEKVLFGCEEVVRILPLAKHTFEFNPISLESKETKEELYDFEGRRFKYAIKIKPQFIGNGEIILKLQFIIRQQILLSQTFGFKVYRNYFIGFPAYDGKPRGNVFWISIFIE
jgi:hypothetical protein